MDAAAELGINYVSKHQIQPGAGRPNPSRETKFSGTNADREILIFPVELTTCRTGNLTRLIHTLAICVTIHIVDTCRATNITNIITTCFVTYYLLLSSIKKYNPREF